MASSPSPAPGLGRPTRAEIDPGAFRHNLALAGRLAGRRKVMAVIKADAYGHGLVPVARALGEDGALAVVSLEEALQLREAGIQQPILLLEGVYEPAELELASAHRLFEIG